MDGMSLHEIAEKNGWSYGQLRDYVESNLSSLSAIKDETADDYIIPQNDVKFFSSNYKMLAGIRNRHEEQKRQKEEEMKVRTMLITSGFSFDGYRITKYSGYISGDSVIQVERGYVGIFSNPENVGNALMKSLKEMRREALMELKEAAYDLGCNAVIGVDFDYITLEPQTANLLTGGTTYLPYVFGVTANGNAVIIEKED